MQDSIIKECLLPLNTVNFWFLLTHSSELVLLRCALFFIGFLVLGLGAGEEYVYLLVLVVIVV